MDVYPNGIRCLALRVRSAGFSLFELLIALSLASILLGVGVSSFSHVTDRIRFDADVAAVKGALSYARMKSVTRNERVIVCRWNGANGCTGHSARGHYQWVHGLAIFNDPNFNKILDTPSESILKIVPFTQLTNVVWSRGEVVAFKPNGSALGYNGTFRLDIGQHRARLILSMTGRLRYDAN
ncbi:MAG: hypothetical protein CSA61_01685 [Neptuniibacter caesariensis]|uniref:Type II secretion system protein H n=1 Tax=Neptuniibacter caesariensis TaxID=207954 RepID=A0A2G6JAR4_NEPCE|nr:MAG: hypothetical protein CSA61_01685 [Neptuniibacter caesariensis]